MIALCIAFLLACSFAGDVSAHAGRATETADVQVATEAVAPGVAEPPAGTDAHAAAADGPLCCAHGGLCCAAAPDNWRDRLAGSPHPSLDRPALGALLGSGLRPEAQVPPPRA